MNILRPDLFVDSIKDIPLEKLQQQGIKGFVIDLDNTITAWNSYEVAEEVMDWVIKAKSMGLALCIASNNHEKRVMKVAKILDLPFLSNAGKPRRKAFKKVLSISDIKADELAVIGDQIFTDVLGGNRMELYTILVVPISSSEFFGTRIMRRMERFVIPYLQKQEVK